MWHILITRPLPGALATASKLGNFKLSILPLTKLQALTPPAAPIFTYDNLIATSSAAFYFLPKIYLPLLQKAQLYCVGEHTSKAALRYGLKQKAHLYKDAQALLDAAPDLSGNSLYICGRRRTMHISNYLANEPHVILELYDTLPNVPNLKILKNFKTKIDVILLTSLYAAQLLSGVQEALDKNVKILCLSQRIAQALPAKKHIYISPEPNEESLLGLIETL